MGIERSNKPIQLPLTQGTVSERSVRIAALRDDLADAKRSGEVRHLRRILRDYRLIKREERQIRQEEGRDHDAEVRRLFGLRQRKGGGMPAVSEEEDFRAKGQEMLSFMQNVGFVDAFGNAVRGGYAKVFFEIGMLQGRRPVPMDALREKVLKEWPKIGLRTTYFYGEGEEQVKSRISQTVSSAVMKLERLGLAKETVDLKFVKFGIKGMWIIPAVELTPEGKALFDRIVFSGVHSVFLSDSPRETFNYVARAIASRHAELEKGIGASQQLKEALREPGQ